MAAWVIVQPRGDGPQYAFPTHHQQHQHHQPEYEQEQQVYTGTRPTSEDVDTIRPSQSASAVQPRRYSSQLQYPHFIRHQGVQPQRTAPVHSAEGRSYTLKNTVPDEAFREVERIYGSRVTASSSAASVNLPFDEEGNPRDPLLAGRARDSLALAGVAPLPPLKGERESGLGLYAEQGNGDGEVPGPRRTSTARRHSAQVHAVQPHAEGTTPHRHSFFGGLAWPGLAGFAHNAQHNAHPPADQQTPTTPQHHSTTAATRVKSILRSGLGLHRGPQHPQPQPPTPGAQSLGSPFTPSPDPVAAEAEEQGIQGDVSSIAPSQSLSQTLAKHRSGRRADRGRSQSKDASGVDPDRRLTRENLEAVQERPAGKMSTIYGGAGGSRFEGWQQTGGSRYGGEQEGYQQDNEDDSPNTVEHGEAQEYPLPPIPPSTAGGRGRSVRSQGQALGLQMMADEQADAAHWAGEGGTPHQEGYPHNLMPGYPEHHRTGTIRTRSNLGWESPPLSDDEQRTELQSAMERMTVGGTTVLGARSGVTGMTGIGGLPSTMTRMRAKLEEEMAAQAREEVRRDRRAAKASKELGSTKRHAEELSEELRKLQAQIIAEKVGRCETEKKAMKKDEQLRIYRDELAAAVRALQRAKDETKRLEEERRKGARLYEETKERLIKYHEAIQVQKARDEGHEQGRLEAFAEIQRWMTAPPIPVEPLEMLPSNALQTPQMANQQPFRQQGPPQDLEYASHYAQAPEPRMREERGSPQRFHQQAGGPYQDRPEAQQNQRIEAFPRPQAQPVQRTQGYTASVHPPPGSQAPLRNASSAGYQQTAPSARGAPSNAGRRSSVQGGRSNYQGPSVAGGNGGSFDVRAPEPPSSGDLPSLGRVHAPISSVPRPPTADAYLDRLGSDPRLRQMLEGAPSGTIPNTVPPASAGIGSGGSVFGNGSDKPLPDPSMPTRARSAYDGRSRATARSLGGMLSPTSASQGGGRHRRQRRGTDLSQENRYPAFSAGHAPDLLQHSVPVFDNPPGARNVGPQSHVSGMPPRSQQTPRSVDPRMIGLPESRAPSAVGLDHRRTGSAASAVRSKLAAGLRGDDEVSLSMIDEREEQEQQMAMPPMPPPSIPPPAAARRAPARSLASMPSFKPKPKPVMPGRLAAPATELGHRGTDGQAFSPQDAQARLDPTWQQPQRMQGPPTINLIPPSRSSHAAASQAGFQGNGPSQAEMAEAFNRAPHEIPLPPTRGNTAISGVEGRRHNPVMSIDWAQRAAGVALPESRPTTMISPPNLEQRSGPGRLAATVETVPDSDAATAVGRSSMKPKSSERPSRRKTSTWVTYEDD